DTRGHWVLTIRHGEAISDRAVSHRCSNSAGADSPETSGSSCDCPRRPGTVPVAGGHRRNAAILTSQPLLLDRPHETFGEAVLLRLADRRHSDRHTTLSGRRWWASPRTLGPS